MEANERQPSLLEDLAPRVKLLFSIQDVKTAIKDIDDGTAALDRFFRLVLSNRTAAPSVSSWRAARLARALRHIRTFADSLHLALLEGFRKECHAKHEARLYLDDRIEIAAQVLRLVGKTSSAAPPVIFNLAFAIDTGQKERALYRTAMEVFEGVDDEHAELTSDAARIREHREQPQLAFRMP